MSQPLDFERRVAAWVADEGASTPPVRVLDEILTATGRQRPLPRWLALIKEPPMRLSSRIAVGSPTARLASVSALTSILILAIAAAAVAATTLLQGPTVAPDRWATYRGDAERRGEGGHGPIGTLQLRWRFDATAGVSRSPTVADGVVYAVSDIGVLHALDEATGAELWRAADVDSHASIVDGLVVATFVDGTVRALDARSGSEKWSTTSPLQVFDDGTGLDVDDTTVYVGTTPALVALDLANGTERWRHADAFTSEYHRPALSDGLVYAGTNTGGFVAVDAGTGELRWREDTGPGFTGTAVATDGIAYIGASSDGGTGRLFAFDAETGSLLWSVDELLFSPAVSDGVAYSGSALGAVTARDALTGEELWRVQVGGPTSPPAVADGVVYVAANGDVRIYALDAATGAELSRFDLDGAISDGLAVANGSVYVGTTAGRVYAIDGDGIDTERNGLEASALADTGEDVLPKPVAILHPSMRSLAGPRSSGHTRSTSLTTRAFTMTRATSAPTGLATIPSPRLAASACGSPSRSRSIHAIPRPGPFPSSRAPTRSSSTCAPSRRRNSARWGTARWVVVRLGCSTSQPAAVPRDAAESSCHGPAAHSGSGSGRTRRPGYSSSTMADPRSSWRSGRRRRSGPGCHGRYPSSTRFGSPTGRRTSGSRMGRTR